ncbi:MAG: spore photoproduct lyase family protein [Candidatus Omnitrophota bacterium]
MIKPELIRNFVDQKCQNFGPNKRQEITRLIYEISKRENLVYSDLLKEFSLSKAPFPYFKDNLIQRRFPNISSIRQKNRLRLAKLDIDRAHKVSIKSSLKFYPKDIFIEKTVEQSLLARRVKRLFPESHFQTIGSYKDCVNDKNFTLKDYNQRLRNLFIVKESFDHLKKCPCSLRAVSCGYHILNLGFGCPYECTYCYLQDYINSPGIVLPANIEDFFQAASGIKRKMRLGSGEFTDSLVFDPITRYSQEIVEFFRRKPQVTFEFKTKSTNIDLLLKTQPAKNIVISWSVNPESIACENEFYAPSVGERLQAAQHCENAGYKIGFHFDPIIKTRTWENDYRQLVDRIFDSVDAKNIAWISLGTLRLRPSLKKAIENRFPDNSILNEELYVGFDDKLRYDDKIRQEIYGKMNDWITKRSRKVWVYLCMEERFIRNQWRKTE